MATDTLFPLYKAQALTDLDMNSYRLLNLNSSNFVLYGTTTVRGINKDVYISLRTDGAAGTGTSENPFDGSTSTKITAILAAASTYTTFHFGIGLFTIDPSFWYNSPTQVNNWFVQDGWWIRGAGKYLTTLKVKNTSAVGGDVHAISSPESVNTSDYCTVSDLTLDCNVQGNGGTNTRAIGLFGDYVTIKDVHVTNVGRSTTGECFVVLTTGSHTVFDNISFGTEVVSGGGYVNRISCGNGNIVTMLPDNDATWARDIVARNLRFNCSDFGASGSGISIQPNGCNGFTLENCYFNGVNSIIYVDTCPNRNVVVRNVLGVNVNQGISLVGAAQIDGLDVSGLRLLHADSTGEQDGIKIATTANSLQFRENYFGYYNAAPSNTYSTWGVHLSGTVTNATISDNTINTGNGGGATGIDGSGAASTSTWYVKRNHTSAGAIATGLSNIGVSDTATATALQTLTVKNINASADPTDGQALVYSNSTGNWAPGTISGSGTVANPSALVGLTAINGSSSSAIRADGAPALNQAITPIWTGLHKHNFNAASLPASPYTGTIEQFGSLDNTSVFALYDAFGLVSSSHNATPHLILRTARGTAASPTTIGTTVDLSPLVVGTLGDYLGFIGGTGYDGTSYSGLAASALAFRPTEQWNSGAHGSNVMIGVTQAGGTTITYPFLFYPGTAAIPGATFIVNNNTVAPTSNGAVNGLHLYGPDNSNQFAYIDVYGTSKFPGYAMRNANGTMASPTASQSTNILGLTGAFGYGTTTWGTTAGAQIRYVATQNWTDSHQGADTEFWSTPNNTNAVAKDATIGSGIVNAVTGFQIGGAATNGHILMGNGTNYVDSPLKQYRELQMAFPHNGDGTNALRITTEGATYGHFMFSNSVAKASNFVLYRFRVPDDLDTTVDLQAALTFRLSAADTGKHSYYISMADVASSASSDLPTFSNEIALSFGGDASGASGDIEQIALTTLTTWAASLTAGHMMVVKLARDGNDGTLDTSTVNSSDVNLTIKYGSTQ